MKWNYDLIVIGGGAAGISATFMAAGLGAKTMLVEKNKWGGDGLWHGRIPAKTLINQAHWAMWGMDVSVESVSEKLKMVQNTIYKRERYREKLQGMGVDVEKGVASFADPHTIRIEKENSERQYVSARYILIAAGSQAFIPPVSGIGRTPYLTSQNLFNLRYLPESMIVVGADSFGLEMSQAFQRLGTAVVVVDQNKPLLPNHPVKSNSFIRETLEAEGILFYRGMRLDSVEGDEHKVRVELSGEHSNRHVVEAEKLLFASGRQVQLETFNLEAAGINTSLNAVTIDRACRTNQSHIFAVGDVAGYYQSRHMSEHMARVAVSNALLKWPMKMKAHCVPRVTYTDPEMAQIGSTREELEQMGSKFAIYHYPYQNTDEAVIEDRDCGWIQVYSTKISGKVLGVEIVGANAGELIGYYALAMKKNISLKAMADTIFPYPGYAYALGEVAGQWTADTRKRHPSLFRLIKHFFRYRGM